MKREQIASRLINLSGDVSPDCSKGSAESRHLATILGVLGLCLLDTKSGDRAFGNYLKLLSKEILKNTSRFRNQGGD